MEKDRKVLRSGTLDIPEEPIQTQSGERWLQLHKNPAARRGGRAPTPARRVHRHHRPQARRGRHEQSHSVLEQRVEERGRAQATIAGRERAESALAHTEEQLRHAQKMEAIGRLAGGIAHDFNNLLMSSRLRRDRARRRKRWRRSAKNVETILRSDRRARGKLTGQLLAFSRKHAFSPQVLDLNAAREPRCREMLLGYCARRSNSSSSSGPELC